MGGAFFIKKGRSLDENLKFKRIFMFKKSFKLLILELS